MTSTQQRLTESRLLAEEHAKVLQRVSDERDRYKAALERLAGGPTIGNSDYSASEIARDALRRDAR